jgi:hypothetical protein
MSDEKPQYAQIANPPTRARQRKCLSNQINCDNENRERDRLREVLVEIKDVRNVVHIAARHQIDE